jgi:hypothetical protein
MASPASFPPASGGAGGKKRGGKFSAGAAEDVPLPQKKRIRSVLVRKPPDHASMHSMPIPALHTTIVIAAKPKPKAKKKGGILSRVGKASALPPAKGPGHGNEPPAPYKKGGHVQVPQRLWRRHPRQALPRDLLVLRALS